MALKYPEDKGQLFTQVLYATLSLLILLLLPPLKCLNLDSLTPHLPPLVLSSEAERRDMTLALTLGPT